MNTYTTIQASRSKNRLDSVRVGSWVLYDFANTIYAASIAYLFIPGLSLERASWVIPASTVAMIIAGLLVPAVGALCDATGRARTFLAVATIVCVAAMANLSTAVDQPLIRIVAFFMVAQVAFQTALVAYNSLLPSVAPRERAGTVSGTGTAVGYLGTFAVLGLTIAFVDTGSSDASQSADFTIRVAAILFMISALPCLFLVRDRRFERARKMSFDAVRSAFHSLGRTVQGLPRQRPLMLFLIGNFLLLDVVNTAVILFPKILIGQFHTMEQASELTLFGQAFEPTPDGRMIWFLVSMGILLNLVAMFAGFILGRLTDRTSGLGVMRLSGICLILALIGAIVFGGQSATAYVFAVVLPGGIGLAGMWTAGRKVVLQLAPSHLVGEYFGLYGLTTKLSVLGMATFALLETWTSIEVALGVQILPALVGLVLLALVRVPNGQQGVQ